jgi:hypothetical protein
VAVALPPGVTPGAIYRHTRFYREETTGELLPKYLAVLGALRGGDVVFRLLTSQPHGRRESPPCCHGDPYPSFYLGVLGGPLTKKSWLDLRGSEDFESGEFLSELAGKVLEPVARLSGAVLRAAMECAAAAADTTYAQEQAIRDQLACL